MTDWPGRLDYYVAVKDAASSFRTKDVLYRSEPRPGDFFGIQGKSGGNAVVFEVTTGNRTGQDYGLKCWTVAVPELDERYGPISKRLAEDQCRKHGWNVHPHFEPHGIQVKGNWWPCLRMDWIRGTPLDHYVASHLKDSPALSRVANSFYSLALNLRNIGIAHGDLQHANILVSRAGGLRLVDYDGMYVGDMPDLQGLPGHYNYYHPQWSPESFGPTNDSFAIWVIYCSLMALSLDSRLWAETANDGPDRDYLLLTEDDFKALIINQGDARSSRGLSAMLDSKNKDVQRIGNLLAEALAVSWRDTPPLTVRNGAIVSIPLTLVLHPSTRPSKPKVARPTKLNGTQVRLPGPPTPQPGSSRPRQRRRVTKPTRLPTPTTVRIPRRLPGPPMTGRSSDTGPRQESLHFPADESSRSGATHNQSRDAVQRYLISLLSDPRQRRAYPRRPLMHEIANSRFVAITIMILFALLMICVPLIFGGK